MKNDLLLIVAILIFIFILWVYSGGPNRPVSFAGPYLTPITNVGQESEAYGPSIRDEKFWNGMVSFRSANEPLEQASGGSANQYGAYSGSGAVELVGGNAASEDPDSEYVVVRNSGSVTVNITGWKIRSEKSGSTITIPGAERVARQSGTTGVLLEPGGEAYITTGSSPSGSSFAESVCTGYLDSGARFTPPLSQNCPAPMDELDAYYGVDAPRYDACAAYVQTIPGCREVGSVPRSVPSSCQDFVDNRLTYRGCVQANANKKGFRTGTWRVFLENDAQLWRGSNESLQLLNTNGTVVDRYAY